MRICVIFVICRVGGPIIARQFVAEGDNITPRVLVLASGAGSTFAALVKAAGESRLRAQFVGLIVDRPALALERAKELQVEGLLVEYRKGDEAWSSRLFAAIESFKPDFIVLAGFLRKVPPQVVDRYRGRIVNSHPALLPRHGGIGMYGSHVHRAVIAAGDRETGITLHHVTEDYDEGTIIAQSRISVTAGDTASSLEQRLKDQEKEFLIDELQKLFNQGHAD